MTCINRVGGQILVLSGELQEHEGDMYLEKPAGIVADIEERVEDGEALDEDVHVGDEVLEEVAGIAAAVEERAEDGEALEEDDHVGEEVLEEGAKTEAVEDDDAGIALTR